MDSDRKSHDANRRAFSERALRGDAAARGVQEEALETLLEWTRPQPTDHVLDLATGAGYLARSFAPRVAWALGVDLVVEMLEAARSTARNGGFSNLAFVAAVVEQLPLRQASFDLVLTRRGPHHFADLAQALDEIRRVLVPGGRLALEDLIVSEDRASADWVNAFERLASPSHGRALSVSEWRAILDSKGFVIEHLETRQQTKDLGPVLARVDPPDRDRMLAFLSTPEAERAGVRLLRSGPPRLESRSILLMARR